MKIAVISDSHDNIPNIKKALSIIKGKGITRGFHLGDFCIGPVLELLSESGIEWTCAKGNNDSFELANCTFPGVDLTNEDFREISLGNRLICITHYPDIARMSALSGNYDAVFHGHTHRVGQEVIGKTLLANPGEIVGQRFNNPSFAIYDTRKNTFRFVFLSKN